MLSQKEAVFNAVINVMGDHEGEYTPSKDERNSIISIVTESFMAGEVSFSEEAQAKYDSADKVKTYVGGLVNNWLRKDKRLNGGIKYQAKNPGSRAGMGDPTVKALKGLLKTELTDEQRVRIESELETRLAELRAIKNKIEIDFGALPEGLAEELGLDIS